MRAIRSANSKVRGAYVRWARQKTSRVCVMAKRLKSRRLTASNGEFARHVSRLRRHIRARVLTLRIRNGRRLCLNFAGTRHDNYPQRGLRYVS